MRVAALRGHPATYVLAYVVLTGLSFPHPLGDTGVVLDLGWIAAWGGPACLALALGGLAPRRAAWVAGLAGWLAHALLFHWIAIAVVRYGNAPWPAGLFAAGALGLYPALFLAAFGGLAARLAGRGPLPPFAGAALWTALEYARSFALTGFPWALLGYTQHENAALLGLAPATGVYGLSFAVSLGGFGLAAGIRCGLRRAAPAFLGVALAHAPGVLALAQDPAEPPGGVRVAVLQGNIDQGRKWSPELVERTLTIYRDLTLRAVDAGAQLVVWPETAVPGAPEADPELHDWLRGLARESGVVLAVGAIGATSAADTPLWHDSGFLFTPDGAAPLRYDKSHLVPFGEYLPLRSLLGGALSALARGIAPVDLTPGPAPRALRLSLGDGAVLTVGTPICYELLFPDLVRRFVAAGGEMLLAMTNDAWYGRTGAPYQFLAMTALRSAETGVWTARAANTGVSALIDPRGRVREQMPLMERGFLIADLGRGPVGADATWYVRHGDRFAQACWLAVAFAALAPGLRRRGHGGSP